MGEVVSIKPKRQQQTSLLTAETVSVWSCGNCGSTKFHIVQGPTDPCASPVCAVCRQPVNAFFVEDV